MPSKSPAQHRLMEALPETAKAYLAGFFDGEGTVGVYESWVVSRGVRRPIWIYQAQIANTSLRSLERILSLVGGSVAQKSKGKANWKQGYVWRMCGTDAACFMRVIRPYTVIKSQEIDEALRFRALCKSRRHKQTTEEIAEKRGIVINIKELKHAKQ